MKFNSLSKLAGAAALTLSLAVLPSHPSNAQTSSPSGTDTTTTQTTGGDRDFDWGWLGLLGLIGLAGLRRKEEPAVRYRDPNEVSSPGPRI